MLPASADWITDEEYLTQLRRTLLHIALSRMNQLADAEEVVQQTLQSLVENRDRLPPKTTALQYAIGTLKHKIADYYRSRPHSGTDELDPDARDPVSFEDQASTEELRRVMQAAIAQLQEECRRLFALLYLGLTLVEMQQRLNAPSVAAIKMRTHPAEIQGTGTD